MTKKIFRILIIMLVIILRMVAVIFISYHPAMKFMAGNRKTLQIDTQLNSYTGKGPLYHARLF